ncbi:MAG: hypothetical protein M1268_04860 [Patescibacteria group bacterium]|nr:hypothetical protein [Patescibacteria group bacterium]
MRDFISSLFRSKIFGLFVLLIIVAAVPLTVFIAQRQQNIQQKAQVANNIVYVNINTSILGKPVPADFVGLSYEMAELLKKPVSTGSTAPEQFTAENTRLIRALQKINVKMIRFGSNNVTRTFWSEKPLLTSPTPPYPTLSQEELKEGGGIPWYITLNDSHINNMFAFARALGAKVVFTLNLAHSDYNPEMFTDEAAYIVNKGGDTLLGIQIDNEPDNFGQRKIRPTPYLFNNYFQEFSNYVSRIRVKVPNAPIIAPATLMPPGSPIVNGEHWINLLLNKEKDDTAGNLKLKAVSQHIYSLGSSTSTDPLTYTTERLLGKDINYNINKWIVDPLVTEISGRHPFYIMETAALGVPGDFAQSLWGINHLLNLAQKGIAGVSLYSTQWRCDPDPNKINYAPVCVEYPWHYNSPLRVGGLYYSLLFFKEAAQGQFVTTQLITALNFDSYSTINGNTLRVTLINKEKTDTDATINLDKDYRMAKVLRLKAPSPLSSGTEITLGGASVLKDSQGFSDWSPKDNENYTVANRKFTVKVPAYSAALVTFDTSCNTEYTYTETDQAWIKTYCLGLGVNCTTYKSITCHTGEQGTWTPYGSNCTKPNCTGCSCEQLITPTSMPPPTNTPAPTSTPIPGGTQLALNLILDGVYYDCNVNQACVKGDLAIIGNPQHPTRNVLVEIFNNNNQLVTTKTGNTTYDSEDGHFKGTVELGSIQTGNYYIKVKTDKYLKRLMPGIHQITGGTTNTIPESMLVAGDIDNNNELNILDYNILISCLEDQNGNTPPTCGDNKEKTDLNDNGTVDIDDYNLFLRNLSVQRGD